MVGQRARTYNGAVHRPSVWIVSLLLGVAMMVVGLFLFQQMETRLPPQYAATVETLYAPPSRTERPHAATGLALSCAGVVLAAAAAVRLRQARRR